MNPLRTWNRFWFQQVSARPLGVFRIVIGLLALCHLGLVSYEADYWLTDHGVMIGSEARELAGAWRPSVLQHFQSPLFVQAWLAGTTFAAVLVTVGWHTRIASALLYFGVLSIYHRMLPTNCGPDELLMIMLFYLMLSPAGAAYSLDARRAARRRGTLAEPLVPYWSMRLVQLQLAMIYLDTAVLKCNGGTWLGGTAVHFILFNPEVGRFNFTFLADYPLLLNVVTYAGLLVEFALPFLMFFREGRKWIIPMGIMLHVGIYFLVNVPLFGELMMACYFVYLTPPEVDAFLTIINPLAWFRRGESASSTTSGHADRAVAAPSFEPVGAEA